MKLGKVENKKGLGIFEMNNKKDSTKDEVIEVAAEYWADAIKNAEENQISFQMGKGIIVVSDKQLDKFKKVFANYIVKAFPEEDNSISLWTSNGEYFDRVGTDSYLRDIMKNSNLPLTCLPSDICMWIYSNRIDIDKGFEHETIYDVNEKTK